MPGLLDRSWAWLQTHEGRKVFRYTMVSLISTVCSFVVIGIAFGLFHWGYVEATLFGNVVATFPNYWLNRNWAWGKSGRSHLVSEILPFWGMTLAGIAFSLVGALVARHIGTTYHLSHPEATLLVATANVISFGIFWVLKLVLFNRIFKVPSLLEEIDEHLEEEEHRPEASGAPAR